MLTLNKDFNELQQKFFKRVNDNLHPQKLSKNLESFYQLDFISFISELKKQKVTLSLTQQDEREPYFTEYQENLLSLKSKIDTIDEKIDEMVFDLYGLTEKEKKIVKSE